MSSLKRSHPRVPRTQSCGHERVHVLGAEDVVVHEVVALVQEGVPATRTQYQCYVILLAIKFTYYKRSRRHLTVMSSATLNI